jgi:voltage-gated potassium channel
MARKRRYSDYRPLRRSRRLSGWIAIGWRVLFVLSLVVAAVAVHWVEREGLKDVADGTVSLIDVLYFTMISITTTGYGDIVPVSDRARLFDALIVTPIRVFVVLIFLGTAYTFVLRRTWDRWRMALIQRNLRDHIVVAGYGTTGAQAVDELIARGIDPDCIVVIDARGATLQAAESLGCAILEGDATRDSVLQSVKIERARAMLISAGRDDTSILVTLTARHLAPDIPISVSVRNVDNELLARQAGATTVINPVSFAGLLLAGSAEGPHIADYIADLASTAGRVQLSERPVREEECGQSLTEVTSGLGVRIYRDEVPHGFWEPEAQTLIPGDVIVEILPSDRVKAD